MGGFSTMTSAVELLVKVLPPLSFPLSVTVLVKVCCGGSPDGLVTAPAVAFNVMVPLLGTAGGACSVATFQRRIVGEPGMIWLGAAVAATKAKQSGRGAVTPG